MRPLFFFLFLLTLVSGINAQQHNIAFSNLLFENGTNLGIVFNTVQDKTGKIWIASQFGLHVYDGKKLITYHSKSKSNPLNIKQLQKILIKNNTLYIAERGSKKIKLFDIPSKIITDSIDFEDAFIQGEEEDLYIQDFDITEQGKIWAISNFSSKNQSLIAHAASKEDIQFVENIFISDYPSIIAKKNQIYCASIRKQLSIFNDKQIKGTFKIPSRSELFYIDKLFLAKDQSTWVIGNCSYDGDLCGVEVFYLENDAKEFKQLDIPELKDIQDLYSIHKHGKHLLLGGELGQLYLYDLETKTLSNLTSDLKSELKKSTNTVDRFHINDIHRTQDGIYWISTVDGLVKLEFKKPLPYTIKSAYPKLSYKDEVYVYNLLPDDKKGLYLSHDEGISYIDSFQNVTVITENTDHISFAYTMALEGDNLYYSEIKYDLKTKKSTYIIPIDDYGFAAPFKIREGKIWFAKWYESFDLLKLSIYDPKTKKVKALKINDENFLKAGRIYDCYQNSNDHLFFASSRGGIFEFSPSGKLLNQINEKKESTIQLAHRSVNTIYEDEYGTIWLGQGNGLTKVNLETKASQHFPSIFLDVLGIERTRSIRSIVSDNNGSLWLGTHQGLLRFDLSNNQFYDFPEYPDLSLGEFRRTASHRNEEGVLFFGTTKGLVIFEPETLQNANAINDAFPLNLRSYSKYDTESKQTFTKFENLESLKRIELSPYDINLRFEYSCPHYYSDQKIFYSHFLKGLDTKWSQPSTKDELTYSQLKAGDYQFQVKALDIKNQLIGDPIIIDIHVAQIWYKRWWVILLTVLAILGLMAAALRYRFQKQLEKRLAIEKLRTKISSDLHDDVGSILTGLAMQTEILQHTAPEKDKPKLSRISNLSRSAMSRMRDSVWAMDAQKDNWQSLYDRMNEFASETLATKAIHFTLSKKGLVDTHKIPGETRQNIYLIFKEAITNILKHSNATEVNISLQNIGAAFEMIIKDNGQLVKKEYKTTGQGTNNMKKRAELIGGNLTLRYKNGFEVLLRTKKI